MISTPWLPRKGREENAFDFLFQARKEREGGGGGGLFGSTIKVTVLMESEQSLISSSSKGGEGKEWSKSLQRKEREREKRDRAFSVKQRKKCPTL